MHIRIRNNVAQLIRTTYDKGSKKGRSTILGKVKLSNPTLDEETRAALTPAELAEFEHWLTQQQRVSLLREELAALTLANAIEDASRWLARAGDSPETRATVAGIQGSWQELRRALKKAGFSD